jgi:hypothetical protein
LVDKRHEDQELLLEAFQCFTEALLILDMVIWDLRQLHFQILPQTAMLLGRKPQRARGGKERASREKGGEVEERESGLKGKECEQGTGKEGEEATSVRP